MILGKITRGSVPVPLYYQVKKRFSDLIRCGNLKPGDIIPPEQKLCSELGVSRGTVRMAIGELVQEGTLRREQGRGTFIAGPRLDKSLLAYFKFADKDTSEEIIPESKIITIENVSPPLEVAKALAITSKETVVRIKRLRTVKGVPFIFQISFFPKKHFPRLDRINTNVTSLYNFISDRYGIHIMAVEEYLTAGIPDDEARGMIGLEDDSPVIIIERIAFSIDERPVEFRRSVGRADRYHYRVRL
jgi:GntR family transcriptional regulator